MNTAVAPRHHLAATARSLRGSLRTPHASFRVLLAFDGQRLTPDLQARALAACVKLTSRLDILLVNPPKAPISLLSGLLLKLEHSGIDYRLVSTHGSLCDEIHTYLRRFRGITTVVLESILSVGPALGMALAGLGDPQDYYFVSLDGS
jgi:hypothetical protein